VYVDVVEQIGDQLESCREGLEAVLEDVADLL